MSFSMIATKAKSSYFPRVIQQVSMGWFAYNSQYAFHHRHLLLSPGSTDPRDWGGYFMFDLGKRKHDKVAEIHLQMIL